MAGDAGLCLAPIPKRLSFREGTFNLRGKRYIKLEAGEPQSLIPAVKMTGLDWELTASPNAPKDRVGLVVRLADGIPDQGYRLAVRPDVIEITASSPAGAFYGACTLAQVLRQAGRKLPCLSISDWPDFPTRGVMIDISRDKVPTMETLFHLVDVLAGWKINQLQLYTEHTFAYLAHPTVWEHASPMTGEQIMELDAHCRSRFIDLVPNQNSFGHMERWLRHDRYRPMAEAPNGCDTEWGRLDSPFSLCPVDRRSIPFLKGLYDELLPHFTSRMFNVGCDETIDLGCGRSKKACGERGVGRVYLDFLLKIHALVAAHGRTMQFWGDVIMNHPELIPELPRDIIALEWGYEFDHPFKERGAKFRDSGVPFYVCPGTSTWLTLAGRTENAIANIESAARHGLAQGAIGLLNTDWGDCGHWQPLSVSYLGYMAGAMLSWNAAPDIRPALPGCLSLHAFGDRTARAGREFYDLGNIYQVFRKRTHNSSAPFQALFWPGRSGTFEGVTLDEFEQMDQRLAEIADAARGARITSPDAAIVREELAHVENMLRLSAEIGKHRLAGAQMPDLPARIAAIKEEHEKVWLLRNRPGGLTDSTARLPLRPGETVSGG